MRQFVCVVLFASATVLGIAGCGPDNSTTVSPVDDSVVQTPEEMAAMEAEYASQQGSR
ncbi:hypothetical protein [Novipirellula artificiosorum]|uniref:Secreted protein n=1 Tax=Novipirellula artificiosorum TaxID=2528016 RepID=A0A5C6DJT6_9BACT|nr:hypothetical protein [Novipirellula artificiosorum]TWU37090.1 hypothetical protein Poly41_32170 [Novipirellula artificiosorum]